MKKEENEVFAFDGTCRAVPRINNHVPNVASTCFPAEEAANNMHAKGRNVKTKVFLKAKFGGT